MATDNEERIAKLEAEVAELKRGSAKPEPAKFEAGGPRGPTTTELAISRVGMPPEVFAEFVKAIPADTIKSMREERRALVDTTPKSSGGAAPMPRNTSGWRDAQPLGNPPGVALADKLMDVQDAKDRAALIVDEGKRLARK